MGGWIAYSVCYVALLNFWWSHPDLPGVPGWMTVMHLGMPLLAIVGTYALCLKLSQKAYPILERTFGIISKYSMEIYLYSDPLNYVILALIGAFALEAWFDYETTWGAMYIFRIVATTLIPIAIALTLKQLKKPTLAPA